MRDPFGPAPALLQRLAEPLAQTPFNFKTLPLHIHEVFASWIFYTVLSYIVSPIISKALFPKAYSRLSQRTRTNWDVHVVSFIQAVLICTLATYVLLYDNELASGNHDWHGRIFGYSGAAGLVQALAAGYFLWDVWISTVHFSVQGPGSLAHAISALAVTTIGFRPFANYYGLVFILYELSTPFLNIHWFLDKLDMTGSRPQLYNGIILITSFGCCRLLWGTYQSYKIYSDIWKAVESTNRDAFSSLPKGNSNDTPEGRYQDDKLSLSLAILYLASNTILLFLNFYWFRAMIQAITKRFKKPKDTKSIEKQR